MGGSLALSYIDEFHKLPSKVGKDIIDLERYAKLPREETYNRIQSFLEAARKSKEVRVLFIVAEWGEGKTSIYEGLLKKPEVIKSDLVIFLPTRNLITFIRENYNKFSDTSSTGLRFFACLLHVLKDIIENNIIQVPVRINIPAKRDNQRTKDFILEGLEAIFNTISSDSRVFIFFDEFEDIVDETRDITNIFVNGIIDIINGHVKELTEEGKYSGRLHLIIAVTPPALQTLRSRISVPGYAKLFGQRVDEVFLEKLDREHAYSYILGILNFCWDGQLPKIPFYKLGMFNTIYLASLGNPRTILNIIEKLLTHAKISVKETAYAGKIKLITPDLFVSALSDLKVQVHGGEAKILDFETLSSLYEKISEKCKKMKIDEEKCRKLLYLFLSTAAPISEEEIRQELNITNKEELFSYMSVMREIFKEKWGITEPFLTFKRAVRVRNESYQTTMSGYTDRERMLLNTFVKVFEFYEYANNKLSNVIFLPSLVLSEIEFESNILYKNFIEYITNNFGLVGGGRVESISENEIKTCDRNLRRYVELSDKLYYMLAPSAFGIFYPLPAAVALDFIEDINQRFKIGREVLSNLVDYESYFYDGILELLKDGCEKVNVEIKQEERGYRAVRFIELSYQEATGEQYKVRAYLLPMLRVVESVFEEKIDSVLRDMKDVHIPLLLILSWQPLSTTIEGILNNKFHDSVFYYNTYILNTENCQKIIGYMIANERRFKINNWKWKEKARRIINEIKFENSFEEFIRKGVREGYVIKSPSLRRLSPGDVPHVLKTLLVTRGSVRDRFNQLKDLEKTFKIYGKTFPVNPKDIQSEKTLLEYIEDLASLGLVEKKEDRIEVVMSPIEERIIKILREYDGLQLEYIEKLFVTPGTNSAINVYLQALEERKRITKDRTLYRLYKFDFEKEFEKIKNKFKELKNMFESEVLNGTKIANYGYLCSIKQRDINIILVKDCFNKVEDIINATRSLSILPGREKDKSEEESKNILLLNLLLDQLFEIYKILKEFLGKLEVDKVKNRLLNVERDLSLLEEGINEKRPAGMNYVVIKEKIEIKEKMKKIENLEEKSYTKDEINKMIDKAIESDVLNSPLCKPTRQGCYVFDLKIFELNSLIGEINAFLSKCEERCRNAGSLLRERNILKNDLTNALTNLEAWLSRQSSQSKLFSSLLSELVRRELYSSNVGGTVVAVGRMEEVSEVTLEIIINYLDGEAADLKTKCKKLMSLSENLSKLINNENELFERIRRAEGFQRSLELFFEGSEVPSSVIKYSNSLKEFRRDVKSKAEFLREEFFGERERLSLDEYLRRIERELNDICQMLNDIEGAHETILNEVKSGFESKLSRLGSFLNLVKSCIAERECSDLQKELDKIREDFSLYLAKIRSGEESVKGSYKVLLERELRLQERVKDTVSKFLSGDELLVLEALSGIKVQEFKGLGRDGLEFDRVIGLLKERLARMSEDYIQSLLIGLSRKGYISLKVFF